MIETGRWICLGAGLTVGLFVGFRAKRKARTGEDLG